MRPAEQRYSKIESYQSTQQSQKIAEFIPLVQVSTFSDSDLNPIFCHIRSKDKAPCPFLREMGLSVCSIRRLRDSLLLDLRVISGSKRDAPARAKSGMLILG
jgi:hypothetical protein